MTDEKTFRRNVSVKVQRSEERNRSADGWSTIAQASWSHLNPDSEPDPLLLDIPDLTGTRQLLLVVDEGDNSALSLAAENDHSPVVRFLRAKGAVETAAKVEKEK